MVEKLTFYYGSCSILCKDTVSAVIRLCENLSFRLKSDQNTARVATEESLKT